MWLPRWLQRIRRPVEVDVDPTCRCGHRRSKHGLMGHPDCTDGAGDFFCLCEGFEAAR